jgi:predicted lipoprotein with Yx(FWY)xxD motif
VGKQPGQVLELPSAHLGRRRRWATVVSCVVATSAVCLTFAACSSSPSSSSSGTTTSSAGSATPIVTTAHNPKYGTILVDDKGRTIYTLTTSAGLPAPCEGQCSDIWPPVAVPAGSTTLTGGHGITGLGKTTSGTVVEYQGFPLFRYSGDTAPGQTNGNGISSYGGTWYVIKVGEKPGTPVTG